MSCSKPLVSLRLKLPSYVKPGDAIMSDSEAFAFRARLGKYLEGFTAELNSAADRRHFCDYVSGLLGTAERKNMERMAFKAGVPVRTLQGFLACYPWDEDAVRGRVQRLVAEGYADDNAIAIIDETGVPKKGTKTAGVQRQYCGAVGKIENSVMFVGLAYAAGDFHTLIDLELYLPKTWAEDTARRRAAGIPEEFAYRSKQDMSIEELRRAIRSGLSFRWATADEFYGRSSRWRREVADAGLWYVVEVPKSTRGWISERIAALGTDSPDEAYAPREVRSLWHRGGPSWTPYRVKDTEKGPEVWELRAIRFVPSVNGGGEEECWLLVARNVLTGEMKYFVSNAPVDCPLTTLGYVAFSRWRVERCFQDLKGEVGLDHFEVHKYRPLVRHLRLALAGMLFLAMERKSLRDAGPWLWSSKAVRQLTAAVLTARDDNDFLHLWSEVLREREYYEKNRQKATVSHGKKRLRQFESMGIDVDTLPRFMLGKVAL